MASENIRTRARTASGPRSSTRQDMFPYQPSGLTRNNDLDTALEPLSSLSPVSDILNPPGQTQIARLISLSTNPHFQVMPFASSGRARAKFNEDTATSSGTHPLVERLATLKKRDDRIREHSETLLHNFCALCKQLQAANAAEESDTLGSDMVAEYVAGIVAVVMTPWSTNSRDLHKFCARLLEAARLPATTVIVGMAYILERVQDLRELGQFKPSEDGARRPLVVALILDSKFMDDWNNEFYNTDWSGASGIPVAELNQMELQWLKAIGFQLFVKPDTNNWYKLCMAHWSDWISYKKISVTAAIRGIVTTTKRASYQSRDEAKLLCQLWGFRTDICFVQGTLNLYAPNDNHLVSTSTTNRNLCEILAQWESMKRRRSTVSWASETGLDPRCGASDEGCCNTRLPVY